MAFTNEDSPEAGIEVFDAAYRKAFRPALNLANELGVRIRSN